MQRRFRLLVALGLTFGLLLLFYIGHRLMVFERERSAEKELSELGCVLIRDCSSPIDRWLEKMFGEGSLSRCVYCEASPGVTDAKISHLQNLACLQSLYLSGPGITDVGLAKLAQIPTLTSIWIDQTTVTDQGIWQLRHLKQLQSLRVTGSHVAEAGLERLKQANPTISTYADF